MDVRIRREVRARGFVGGAFARAAGVGRYEWRKELGNRCILTGEPGTIIDKPSAAGDLLALATRLSEQGRRVLFFCSCRWPIDHGGEDGTTLYPCDRTDVGRLVLEYAREDGDPGQVEVIEWPGGDPVAAEVHLPQTGLRRLRGRKSIPLGSALPSPEWCGLPWGSMVDVHGKDGMLHAVSGPASFSCGAWQLPVFEAGSSDDAWNPARRFREHHGLEGRT